MTLAKSTADNVSALKGVQSKKPRNHFSATQKEDFPGPRVAAITGALQPSQSSAVSTLGILQGRVSLPNNPTSSKSSTAPTPSFRPGVEGGNVQATKPRYLNLPLLTFTHESTRASDYLCCQNGSTSSQLGGDHLRPVGTKDSKGYTALSWETSHQHQAPVMVATKGESRLISQEVKEMLMKGALQVVQLQTGSKGFYSKLFLVPKKGGKHRPVISLKSLNHFTFHQCFKMEGNQTVRELLQ